MLVQNFSELEYGKERYDETTKKDYGVAFLNTVFSPTRSLKIGSENQVDLHCTYNITIKRLMGSSRCANVQSAKCASTSSTKPVTLSQLNRVVHLIENLARLPSRAEKDHRAC